MNNKILIPIVVLVAVAALAAAFAFSGGETEESELHPPVIDGMPDSFVFDEGTGTIDAGKVVEWEVFDYYHKYCNEDKSTYKGYKVSSQTLTLEPGKYNVRADGSSFGVFIDGHIERTAAWTYDMEGEKKPVSVEFDFTMYDFMTACDASKTANKACDGSYMFYDLPKLISVDDCIRTLEKSLASEYKRIGGSVSDRQGYADFLASFVQLNIEYPPSVSGKQYDHFVWGEDEYWCVPLETLYHMMGDCEDTAALLCSVYEAAGYESAIGGKSGHVFSGVHIDGYTEVPKDRLDGLKVPAGYDLCKAKAIEKLDDKGKDVYYPDVPAGEETLFYAVETIKDQIPVGYLSNGDRDLDKMTKWGWSGFYTTETQVFPEVVTE